jgi:hypothetical protein
MGIGCLRSGVAPGFSLRLGDPDRDDFGTPMFHSTVGMARPKKFVFPARIFLPWAGWIGVESAASRKNG